MANIKVKDLTDTQTINTDNEIMVLTNENTNLVQNITVENFITNVISSDSDNVIEQGADGKLYVETPENITGELSDLTTTDKSSLVAAINEVDGDIGNLANLTTSAKTSVVDSINSEVSARGTAETNIQNDYNNKIGTLSNLDTTDKSNIVGAINEIAAVAVPSLQYETMNNSKALETGAPSSDTTILADIQKYAHSTFDLSKFTVVGTPTITDDGIASGFSSSNYLVTNTFSFGTSSWEMAIAFTFTSTGSGNKTLYAGKSANASAPMLYVRNNQFSCYVPDTIGNWGFTKVGVSQTFTTNTKYWLKFGYNSLNSHYYAKVSTDGINYTTKFDEQSSYILLQGSGSFDFSIGYNKGYNTNPFDTGSIDLNSFKVYVDGNLVYQPCLKIPYTLSKTGSKIVNSVYRDRVIDCYNYEGVAPYYTLDEVNRNFTLPMGELYGYLYKMSKESPWVYSSTQLLSNASAVGTYDLTTALTAALPSDSNQYECIFRVLSNGTTTSGSIVTTNNIVISQDVGSADVMGYQFIGIIDDQRNLEVEITYNYTDFNLELLAYKKIN